MSVRRKSQERTGENFGEWPERDIQVKSNPGHETRGQGFQTRVRKRKAGEPWVTDAGPHGKQGALGSQVQAP